MAIVPSTRTVPRTTPPACSRPLTVRRRAASPATNRKRPSRPSEAGVALSFAVDDVDALTDAAVSAGCGVLDAPADQPWGERQSVLTDPDGHVVCLVARLS